MKYLKKHRFKLGLSIILSILAAWTLVLTPLYLGRAMDAMIGKGAVDFPLVFKMLSYVLVYYLLNFLTQWLASLLANEVSISTVEDMRLDLKYHMDHVPLNFLDTHAQGDLLSLFTNDGELMIDGLFQTLNQVTGAIFTVLLTGYFMFVIDVPMTLIVLAMLPFVYFSSTWVSRKSMKHFRHQQKQAGELGGFAAEYLDNYELIEAYMVQDDAIAKFEELNDALVDVGVKAQFIAALTNPTARLLHNVVYALLGLGGAYAIFREGLSIGVLTSFLSYATIFSKPFNEISAIMPQILVGKAAYERYMAIFKEPLKKDDMPDFELKGETIKFTDVDFSYVEHRPILKDLNLDIKPLSKVAIVGPTGAGKSTLINVLMRYYEIDRGSVEIDGVDTSSVSLKSVRDVIGIVLQDPWLFSGTISDNIKYGRPHASLDDVKRVAMQVGIHEYVMSLDDQYDTFITTNISQGQKQLITIARALILDAPIMILDEATSSVDSLSEKHIQSVFTQIMKSHTSFFVAHRLSTVIDSDLILVMKDGRLIEQGNHEALVADRGFYYKLYMSQYEGGFTEKTL